VLAAMVGAVIGGTEGPIVAARHFPRVVMLDLVELLILGSVLLVGVVKSMDRLLWTFIVLYAVKLALNIIWMSARAWIGAPDVWVPSARGGAAISAAFWAAMLLTAGYRHRLARRGRVPDALLRDPQMPGGMLPR
jgi:hypothetical protein